MRKKKRQELIFTEKLLKLRLLTRTQNHEMKTLRLGIGYRNK